MSQVGLVGSNRKSGGGKPWRIWPGATSLALAGNVGGDLNIVHVFLA